MGPKAIHAATARNVLVVCATSNLLPAEFVALARHLHFQVEHVGH
jgi:hypothetical protein